MWFGKSGSGWCGLWASSFVISHGHLIDPMATLPKQQSMPLIIRRIVKFKLYFQTLNTHCVDLFVELRSQTVEKRTCLFRPVCKSVDTSRHSALNIQDSWDHSTKQIKWTHSVKTPRKVAPCNWKKNMQDHNENENTQKCTTRGNVSSRGRAKWKYRLGAPHGKQLRKMTNVDCRVRETY